METAATSTPPCRLEGFIDEGHLTLAEREFPGIVAFYERLRRQDPPRTFLELLMRFEAFAPRAI